MRKPKQYNMTGTGTSFYSQNKIIWQKQQKAHKDNKSRPRAFHVNDSVLVVSLPGCDSWFAGMVVSVLGSRTYEICSSDGRTARRHIHPNLESPTDVSSETDLPTDWVPIGSDSPSLNGAILTHSADPPDSPALPPPPRRSGRTTHPPNRLIDQYNP